MRIKILGAGSIGNHLSHAARALGWSVDLVDRRSAGAGAHAHADLSLALRPLGRGDPPVRDQDHAPEAATISSASARRPTATCAARRAPPSRRGRAPSWSRSRVCGPDLAGAQELADEAHGRRRRRSSSATITSSGARQRLRRRACADGRARRRSLTLDVEFREHWGGIFGAHPWLAGPVGDLSRLLASAAAAPRASIRTPPISGSTSHTSPGAGRVVEVQATLDFVRDDRVRLRPALPDDLAHGDGPRSAVASRTWSPARRANGRACRAARASSNGGAAASPASMRSPRCCQAGFDGAEGLEDAARRFHRGVAAHRDRARRRSRELADRPVARSRHHAGRRRGAPVQRDRAPRENRLFQGLDAAGSQRRLRSHSEGRSRCLRQLGRFDFKDLFVLDLANNHQGSVEHGSAIIKGCADAVDEARRARGDQVPVPRPASIRAQGSACQPDQQACAALPVDAADLGPVRRAARGGRATPRPARDVHALRRGLRRQDRRRWFRRHQGRELLGARLAAAREGRRMRPAGDRLDRRADPERGRRPRELPHASRLRLRADALRLDLSRRRTRPASSAISRNSASAIRAA